MYFIRKKGWEISENQATSEDVFVNRRRFLIGGGSLGFIGASLTPANALFGIFDSAPPPLTVENDPTRDLYPVKRNMHYTIERAITPAHINAQYNNFYEFGSHKKIFPDAQKLQIRPWDIIIDGDVETPITIGIDDLIRKMPLEERLYRLRCVEAWSMTIPWSGFPLSALLAMVQPLSSAKYVRFEAFHDPNVASGQRQTWYPWPYVEGMTIEEAANDLAFLVTGAYGKPLAKQFGSPLRLALPWKYGFKSIKSIKRITFTQTRPKSFWEKIQSAEYGFWANVNPQIPHPRWSQASEKVLGTNERIKTHLFNGYAEQVASLYPDLDNPIYFR